MSNLLYMEAGESIIPSICIIVICGFTLLIFSHYNEYKRVERHFFMTNKYLYIVLEICYYLLFISFVYNSRYLVYQLIKHLFQKYYKIKINL
jgi:hypothetical protein